MATGTRVHVLTLQRGPDEVFEVPFHSLAAFAPPRTLALAPRTERGGIEIWDIVDKKRVRELVVKDRITALAISPDGHRVLAGIDHDCPRLWRLP